MDKEVVPVAKIWNRCFLILFAVALGCYVLQAYSIFHVPIPWIGSVLAALGGCAVIRDKTNRFFLFTCGILLVSLVCWYGAVNLIHLPTQVDSRVYTGAGMVSYAQFVGLRFFTIVVFFLATALVFHLVIAGLLTATIRVTVWIGAIASFYALCEYFLYGTGFALIERTRAGAFGTEGQPIYFTYAFHRAVGTFIEPSHLGVFLIIPTLLGLSLKSFFESRVLPVLTMSTLLLTGSLTAILSVIAGVIAAFVGFWIVAGWRRAAKCVLLFTIIAIIGWVIFVVSVRVYTASESSLHQAHTGSATGFVVRRASSLIVDGMDTTNRAYIYRAIMADSLPIVGYGLGNAYVVLSHLVGIPQIASFLNLYLNALYSGGIVAVILTIGYLLLPLILWFFLPFRIKFDLGNFYIFATYMAWLVVYCGLFDEFHVVFGIPYALLLASVVTPEFTRFSISRRLEPVIGYRVMRGGINANPVNFVTSKREISLAARDTHVV